MANELAPSNKKPITIKEYMSAPAVLKKMQEMFQTPEAVRQFSTAVISIAGSDELLAQAEPRSLFNAALTAASLNLAINKNLGFAHIIGYRNNRNGGVVEAQFQLGARGFKELAQRSGQYKFINQGDVRQGEMKGRNRLTGEIEFTWCENEADRLKLPVIGYFSYFQLQNGFSSTLYMSKEEVIEHGKKYSQAFKRGYGPWVDNFEAMALKTVSKLNISKNGPLSIEMQKAISVDQAVIRDEDKFDYVDGELADVGADEDEKAAIIAANTEDATTEETAKNVRDNLAPVGASLAHSETADDGQEPTEEAKPAEPKKSVKEQAEEWKNRRIAKNHEGEQQGMITDDGHVDLDIKKKR